LKKKQVPGHERRLKVMASFIYTLEGNTLWSLEVLGLFLSLSLIGFVTLDGSLKDFLSEEQR
jgi:hypothetical protein